MIPVSQLEEVTRSQKEVFLSRDPGIPRTIDVAQYTKTGQIVAISGIRRCGKSTLLRQIAQQYDAFHYINFDDERLIDFTTDDFSSLVLILEKIFPSLRVLFIDEIQNVAGWERFVRRIHDEGWKVFLTGSNANLLSAELGTHLTGRYVKITLFPFSFQEALAFRDIPAGEMTETTRAAVLSAFDRYLVEGGFPEYLKFKDPEYLKRTYEDILFRDIIGRAGIREVKPFRQLARYIFTNVANRASYQALKKTLNFKSAASVRDYVGYLEEAYLVFEIFRYDCSLKKQYVSDKKLYCIDTGMRNAVAFRFSGDTGRLFENLVFIELLRRNLSVYYFRQKHECDFVIEDRGVITAAIQVCFELNEENRSRELAGLTEAMETLSVENGMVLTCCQEETLTIDGRKIRIVPAWKWLLGSAGHKE